MQTDDTADIAFGVRKGRQYQNRFEKLFSNTFYKLINAILKRPLDDRLGDF